MTELPSDLDYLIADIEDDLNNWKREDESIKEYILDEIPFKIDLKGVYLVKDSKLTEGQRIKINNYLLKKQETMSPFFWSERK